MRAFVFAFLCGVVVAFVAQIAFEPTVYDEYDEDQAYPAEEWRMVHKLRESPTGLEYRQSKGIVVTTSRTELQITGADPTCLVDGDLARYREHSSLPIKLTSSPRVQLPSPPKSPLYQLTFDIPIQLDDTDILGASSFAVYENGEVWCSERFLQRGQGVGVAVAFAGGGKSSRQHSD